MEDTEGKKQTPQGLWLSILNRVPAEEVKAFVEGLLPQLEPHPLEVLQNRTGLVMLPGQDTAQGECFHLGEVLVSEAWVRLAGHQGYTLCLGRDLEQALAVAILDAALQADLETPLIQTFVNQHKILQQAQDLTLLRQVEATRVEMETF